LPAQVSNPQVRVLASPSQFLYNNILQRLSNSPTHNMATSIQKDAGDENSEDVLDLEMESIDEDGSMIDGAQVKKRIDKLRADLMRCQAEKKEYLEGWQRSKADQANARREMDEERSGFYKLARSGLLKELLPLADTFEAAIGNKEAWEKVDKNWRIGVEYIYKELQKILRDNGLEEIGTVGEIFDPAIHVSLATDPTLDSSLDHTVSRVRKTGYKQDGRVLRAAEVHIYTKDSGDN